MIIQRVTEADQLSYGINYRIDERSFLFIHLVLPLGFSFPTNYEDFASQNIFYGWRIRKLFLRFRIRRWTEFPPGTRKFLYSARTTLHAIGKQILISTYEQLVDGY